MSTYFISFFEIQLMLILFGFQVDFYFELMKYSSLSG